MSEFKSTLPTDVGKLQQIILNLQNDLIECNDYCSNVLKKNKALEKTVKKLDADLCLAKQKIENLEEFSNDPNFSKFEELKKENSMLREMCTCLKEDNNALRRRIFSPKSEKTKDEDFSLLREGGIDIQDNKSKDDDEDEDENEPGEKQKKKRQYNRKNGRNKGKRHNNIVIKDDLPRKHINIQDSGPDRCECGALKIKVKEEEKEVLVFIPGHFEVHVYHRNVYACTNCESPDNYKDVSYPEGLPPQILPTSIFGNEIIADIVILKFQYGLTYYRLTFYYGRMGVEIPRSTMSRLLIEASEVCDELWELMLKEVLSGEVLNSDETPIQVLNEKGKKNTQQSTLFALCGGEEGICRVFIYADNKRQAQVDDLLGSYVGYLQTDGSTIYNIFDDKESVIRVPCLAHIRRKFYDAQQNADKNSCIDLILGKINDIFFIEEELRGYDLPNDEFVRIRKEWVTPIMDEIGKILISMIGKVPSKSLFGRALKYAADNWPDMYNYLKHYRLHPDNMVVSSKIKYDLHRSF